MWFSSAPMLYGLSYNMQAPTRQLAYDWPMPGGRPAKKPAPKFGQRVAAFRIAKGLSQEQLAEKLGMTRARIVYYERAATNPSLDVVEKVAEFFGVTVGELLNDIPKVGRKPGPPSQFAQIAEQLDKLPRAQQKVVAQMLEGFLKRAS
jgi:transcriptional regulator with XRE-family HTH domain